MTELGPDGQIVWSFFDLVSNKQLDAAVALLNPSGRYWVGTHGAGIERDLGTQRDRLRAIFEEVPMRFQLHSALEHAGRVVLELESHAEGPADGYNNRYCFIALVSQGQIIRMHEYCDTDHAYRVLIPLISGIP